MTIPNDNARPEMEKQQAIELKEIAKRKDEIIGKMAGNLENCFHKLIQSGQLPDYKENTEQEQFEWNRFLYNQSKEFIMLFTESMKHDRSPKRVASMYIALGRLLHMQDIADEPITT